MMKKKLLIIIALLVGAGIHAAQESQNVASRLKQKFAEFGKQVSLFRKNYLDLQSMRQAYTRCYSVHISPINAKIKELEGELKKAALDEQDNLMTMLDQAHRTYDEKWDQHCKKLKRKLDTLETIVASTRSAVRAVTSVLN